jgi:hypothetical protein
VVSRTVQARTAFLAVAVCLASPVHAQRHLWDPESRVVVTDAGTVLALATGPREVFASTPRQIVVRDLVADAWRFPIPLPADAVRSGPTALAIDTRTGGLWLGTEAGDLYSVTPGIWQWDRIAAAAAGPIDAIVDGARDAYLYYRSRGQWRRLPGGSSFPEPVPPTGVPAAVLRAADGAVADPFLRAAAGTLGLDPLQRNWRITDTKPGADPGVFWVATAGGGIVRFDSRATTRGWFRFGTQAAGTASIAPIDGLVWFGGNGAGPHDGVATATPDLGTWLQFDSGDGAPRGFVAEIVAAFDRVWFASSDGLFSLPVSVATERIRSAAGSPGVVLRGRTDRDPGSRPAWSRLTASDGLPSDQVRSLTRAGDRLWVGTERGAVALDAAGHVTTRILSGSRVSRMAVSANSLLLATAAGLYRVGIDDTAGEPTRIVDPALTARVTDVVATADGPFVVVDGLVRRSGPGAAIVRDAALDRIGPALRLAWADGRLWVAGSRGIAVMEAATRRWIAFTVPEDLPAGPVTDVAPAGDVVWAATPAGAIRLRWR